MHQYSQMDGFADAVKLVTGNMSPRAHRMANFERYVEGTQYAGRPDFFDRSVPLWYRAPCVVYPLVANAISSNTDLVIGETRWPRLTSRPSEDDGFFDETGLNESESAILDKFVYEVQRQCRFHAAMREAFTAAQGCGSAGLIFGVREGHLFVDSVKARWCEPEFAADGSVQRLVIEYPYYATFKARNTWKVVPKMYRREIDDTKDVTFRSENISSSGCEPMWEVESSVEHGMGFCPVVWYQFMSGCSVVDNHDGHPIHEFLLDEITALDFALSMKHRAALYAGDPQWTEVGVEPGYVPTQPGELVSVPSTSMGGPISGDNRPTGEYRAQVSQKQGRRKGPGEVWQYESPDVKVQLHSLPGDALTSLENHCMDLRMKLAESLSAVFLDADSIRMRASGLSGKALEVVRARQIDRCEQYRDDCGSKLLLPSMHMLLRICHTMGMRGQLRIAGINTVLQLLGRSYVESA